jgi:phosphoribosyl 1,2-cyclic phosphodiesterase
MRFCLLASGSKGNCVWIEEGPRAILIDNGLSCAEFMRRARLAGLDVSRIGDVVVSHEHVDHIGGVGPLARKLKLRVHLTGVAAGLFSGRIGEADLRTFEPGETLDFDPISLTALTGSHDSADPVVFVARGRNKALGLATDLGTATLLVRRSLSGMDGLILEFNHDLGMLINGPYPPELKQRVRGRRGHLSNDEAAEVFKQLNHPGLKEVVLAHLSQINNTPELARLAAESALEGAAHRPNLTVADQSRPTPVLEI